MRKLKKQRREPSSVEGPDKLLESYYEQLVRWGLLLTRGDRGTAEDIVHDLCLHFTLSKPDLSSVTNLDGYLYICLRNIYLSGLARSSREAMQFVSVADFESAKFALAAGPLSDLLERQNDLIRICTYSIWRKGSSKSASYFILHFFHGYFRREVAAIARIPLSAIYNKLKIARTEIKSHLEDSSKLRIATRLLPPSPQLLLSPVSSTALFNLLRVRILQARESDCLPEEELLAHYQALGSIPISCPLLSHIVSCERCLALIDRNSGLPTLEDRGPLDALGGSTDAVGSASDRTRVGSYNSFLDTIQQKRDRIYEHRPKTLSIAVNGKIVALHDIEGKHSRLSSRIEHPEDAQFVEVFSEQQQRMAFLPIQERPPNGPHVHKQHVALSDSRWLELTVSFDGLGLHGEVSYFDPVLATESIVDEMEAEIPLARANQTLKIPQNVIRSSHVDSTIKSVTRILQSLVPKSVPAWTLVLASAISLTGYLAYRQSASKTLTASQVLSRSIQAETIIPGQTEHQLLQVEVISSNGAMVDAGTVELWRDGGGSRYARRFYDTRHHLLASEWHTKNGQGSSSSSQRGTGVSSGQQMLLASELWKQDLSSQAFRSLVSGNAKLNRTAEGYELIESVPISVRPQLISATLVLNQQLHSVRQILHVRDGNAVEEVLFVEKIYQRRSSSSIDDGVFTSHESSSKSIEEENSTISQNLFNNSADHSVHLAQLHIAVLYQLSQLGADIGEPIEVVRTHEGEIRVSGTLSNDARRAQITSKLAALPDHRFLNIRLVSSSSLRNPLGNSSVEAYPLAITYDARSSSIPASDALRRHFQSEGLSGTILNSSMQQFSRDALQHAQRALQDAYALDRLGVLLAQIGPASINLSSQQQWTEMVRKHSSDLEIQLQSLDNQFAAVSSWQTQLPESKIDSVHIYSPAEFTQAANHLLHQMQDLEHNVGRIFANTSTEGEQQAIDTLVVATKRSLPIGEAKEIGDFAGHLATSVKFVAHSRNKAELPVTSQ